MIGLSPVRTPCERTRRQSGRESTAGVIGSIGRQPPYGLQANPVLIAVVYDLSRDALSLPLTPTRRQGRFTRRTRHRNHCSPCVGIVRRPGLDVSATVGALFEEGSQVSEQRGA